MRYINHIAYEWATAKPLLKYPNRKYIKFEKLSMANTHIHRVYYYRQHLVHAVYHMSCSDTKNEQVYTVFADSSDAPFFKSEAYTTLVIVIHAWNAISEWWWLLDLWTLCTSWASINWIKTKQMQFRAKLSFDAPNWHWSSRKWSNANVFILKSGYIDTAMPEL